MFTFIKYVICYIIANVTKKLNTTTFSCKTFSKIRSRIYLKKERKFLSGNPNNFVVFLCFWEMMQSGFAKHFNVVMLSQIEQHMLIVAYIDLHENIVKDCLPVYLLFNFKQNEIHFHKMFSSFIRLKRTSIKLSASGSKSVNKISEVYSSI